MPRFELRRLETYEEKSLLAEIRRVGKLIENPLITQAQFNRISKASSSSIRKRFGTWESALARAGWPIVTAVGLFPSGCWLRLAGPSPTRSSSPS